MYRKVIVPTDGSRVAREGILKGLKLAGSLEIPAYSVYVLDIDKYEQIKGDEVRKSEKRNMKKVAEKALRWVRHRAHDLGVNITTEILIGEPYEKILENAGRDDVIYMSSHGASGIKEILLGSTTERVLKNAECTVTVVKSD